MTRKQVDYFINWENRQSVLITGASSGLGADYAREFAKRGFNIILIARRKNRLQELAHELEKDNKITTEIIVADLANEKDRKQVVSRIIQKQDIEVLINNAGFGVRGKFHENPIEKYQEMMLVHMNAPVEFTRAAIPGMKVRGRGVIINMSSFASLMKNPRSGIYRGSKKFLNIFSEFLAYELNDFGIKLQALCPGMTISEFHSVRDYVGWDRGRVPDKLWMTSEEVIKESLNALSKKKTIYIPGKRYRRMLWFWNRPILGKILLNRLRKRNR